MSVWHGGWLWCLPRQLLQHECPQCPQLPPFGLFGDLEQHMRKQHELFCCKLCLKHLKVRLPWGWAALVCVGVHGGQTAVQAPHWLL